MAKQFRTIRGIHDGLTSEVKRWQHIEQTARDVFRHHAFSEVRLPVLEPTALFVRSIGEETDIVSKEMYRFEDRGGEDICLRPEGTAGAVRAYLQAGLTRSGPQRWYYVGPMFRRERPQKGRLRQFQQIGVEWFGVSGPSADAELLTMAHTFLSALGIPSLHPEINSLGCPVCRPAYRGKLAAYLESHATHLCETCNTRMEKNPMRVLDCKIESCQTQLAEAPEMASHLCHDCETHFSGLKQALDALDIPYCVNPRIVRGLDYYNRTAFEIVTRQLGAQGTVLAGGRYDGLVEELGGPATPAVGFALGLERLAMLLPEAETEYPDIGVVVLGDSVRDYALNVVAELRKGGCSVVHCGGGIAKRQFRAADREHVRFVAVTGEDEMAAGNITLKDMLDGSQKSLLVEEVIALVRQRNK
ncbi:MAG: histidine--tRNA ligase [Mariprofundaceae bacterium]|nr:histidine--tRNA ligase [Mariprofundaceae bacterium]